MQLNNEKAFNSQRTLKSGRTKKRWESHSQMEGRSTWKSTWVCKGEAQGTCPQGRLRLGLVPSGERRSVHESGSRALGEREELNLGNLILRPRKARMWENRMRSSRYSILPWSMSRRKSWAERWVMAGRRDPWNMLVFSPQGSASPGLSGTVTCMWEQDSGPEPSIGSKIISWRLLELLAVRSTHKEVSTYNFYLWIIPQ